MMVTSNWHVPVIACLAIGMICSFFDNGVSCSDDLVFKIHIGYDKSFVESKRYPPNYAVDWLKSGERLPEKLTRLFDRTFKFEVTSNSPVYVDSIIQPVTENGYDFTSKPFTDFMAATNDEFVNAYLIFSQDYDGTSASILADSACKGSSTNKDKLDNLWVFNIFSFNDEMLYLAARAVATMMGIPEDSGDCKEPANIMSKDVQKCTCANCFGWSSCSKVAARGTKFARGTCDGNPIKRSLIGSVEGASSVTIRNHEE